MAKSKKSEDVPQSMAEKFNSIIALTDDFALHHLNAEYAQQIRYATAALCRKRPSPLAKGQSKTWACGITHAIGMVNFLFDSSQTPHISASELYQEFGVSNSTGQAKSKLVRDTLKMGQLDPEWTLPSRVDTNPLSWMVSINGFIMDIRSAPFGAQIEAYRKGLIPYIPGHKEDSDAIANAISILPAPPERATSRQTRQPSAAKQKTRQPTDPTALQALYIFNIILIDGPVTEKFLKKNPQVIRTIEIRGDQTLADFHQIIFNAFDREEEHLYEFQLRGKGPNDPNADRYGLILPDQTNLDDELTEDVTTTPIGTLDLAVEESFGYWFDFGDNWWHQIAVMEITSPQPKINYPRITHRIGASPPQYEEFE